LEQFASRIEAMRSSVAYFSELGQRMAEPLLAGGDIFTPAISSFFPHEFCNRAGGLMGMRPATFVPRSRNDVAYFAFPDTRFWHPAKDASFRSLLSSPAKLFAVGRPEDLPASLRRHIDGFTGGDSPLASYYAVGKIKPLISFRPFEQLVRGWLTAGEMITACLRAGRMPVIWMSVWLEGALARNASLYAHDNLREPWSVPLFHERRYIPPLPPGYAAKVFLEELSSICACLMAQAQILGWAGEWMAEACRRNRKIHAVAVGHCYPRILEVNSLSDYPIRWANSASDLNVAVPLDIAKGDVALHLGYAPVDVTDVHRILARGVKLIYTSPYGRPASLEDHPNLLWLDLPWRPGDATVDIPGYGVRILPMSSSSQTMAYYAILANFAEWMGWK